MAKIKPSFISLVSKGIALLVVFCCQTLLTNRIEQQANFT